MAVCSTQNAAFKIILKTYFCHLYGTILARLTLKMALKNFDFIELKNAKASCLSTIVKLLKPNKEATVLCHNNKLTCEMCLSRVLINVCPLHLVFSFHL